MTDRDSGQILWGVYNSSVRRYKRLTLEPGKEETETTSRVAVKTGVPGKRRSSAQSGECAHRKLRATVAKGW